MGFSVQKWAPKTVTRADRRFEIFGLATFVTIGMPDGMLGTAWPAMRHTFGASVGDLGLILLVSSLGSMAVSAFVGRLIQRIGVSALLAVACSCAALGGVGFALAPGFWFVLCIGPLAGAASGMLDGGLNTAVALTGRSRLLNLLHGFYGIGTALGPLVVTAAILAGSWRPAYLCLIVVDLAAAGCWIFYHRLDPPSAPASSEGGAASAASNEVGNSADASARAQPTAGWARSRAATVLAAGLVVFFVYTGLEVGAGQWETSYLRGHLGLSASAAGLAAFGYWGALTVVRLGLALPTKSVPAQRLIGGGVCVSVAATALIWWAPDIVAVIVGFVVLGAALAGLFPALMALTPERIGAQRAQHAIAWQVGASAGGGSLISALIGLLINTSGLKVLGPSLVVLALLLLAANTALARLAPVPSKSAREGIVRRTTARVLKGA